ncbi:MAG: hypothetical protein II220_04460, partial [Spirochaetales bacterium]|nr:hypothetical protein [Spirochaetales bacterium]
MLKKINCYLCVLLMLFVGCLNPDEKDFDDVGETDKKEQSQPKQNDKNNESEQEGRSIQNDGESQEVQNDNEPKNKNLGSIFFFGNSHTFNTANLETMIKENGYEAKIYHVNTGGTIPLGNDNFTNNIGLAQGTDDHLSHLLSRVSLNKITPEVKLFPEDLSWIVVHDGTIHNSLTSAGAFMGLASAFGAKTACYQSWDLKEQSAYAAKKFQLPMIPVGGVIHYPEVKLINNNSEYQVADGHMNNKGKYIYCVLFTHFFTGLSIDEIQGNGNLSDLTEENKKEMKELMKKILTDTDKIFKDIKPYYECVKDFDSFKIDKACKSIEVAKEYSMTLQLSQPAIFKLPEGQNGKKLKVEVKSNNENIVPDIWFYDTNG